MFEHLLDLCADNNIRVTIHYESPYYCFEFSTYLFRTVWTYKYHESREFLKHLVNRDVYWDKVFSMAKDALSEKGIRQAILRQQGEE